jgi:hypothetical protein
VSDTTGAPIPGAQIGIENLQTDISGKLHLDLNPGEYGVTVDSQGFFRLIKKIDVQASKEQAFRLALQVGSCSPCVTVQQMMGNPLVPTSLPSHSKVIAAAASLVLMGSDNSKLLDAVALKRLQHKTITVHNPHENVDETYSGVLLIELLKQVGAPVGKDVHGKALAEYVVATGSDGYKAVLALAEIEPDFHPGDVLVADAMDGKPLDSKTGPFRLVVTEDKRPARSVRNLVSVELKSAE